MQRGKTSGKGTEVFREGRKIGGCYVQIVVFENWGDLLFETYEPRTGEVATALCTSNEIKEVLQEAPEWTACWEMSVKTNKYDAHIMRHICGLLDFVWVDIGDPAFDIPLEGIALLQEPVSPFIVGYSQPVSHGRKQATSWRKSRGPSDDFLFCEERKSRRSSAQRMSLRGDNKALAISEKSLRNLVVQKTSKRRGAFNMRPGAYVMAARKNKRIALVLKKRQRKFSRTQSCEGVPDKAYAHPLTALPPTKPGDLFETTYQCSQIVSGQHCVISVLYSQRGEYILEAETPSNAQTHKLKITRSQVRVLLRDQPDLLRAKGVEVCKYLVNLMALRPDPESGRDHLSMLREQLAAAKDKHKMLIRAKKLQASTVRIDRRSVSHTHVKFFNLVNTLEARKRLMENDSGALASDSLRRLLKTKVRECEAEHEECMSELKAAKEAVSASETALFDAHLEMMRAKRAVVGAERLVTAQRHKSGLRLVLSRHRPWEHWHRIAFRRHVFRGSLTGNAMPEVTVPGRGRLFDALNVMVEVLKRRDKFWVRIRRESPQERDVRVEGEEREHMMREEVISRAFAVASKEMLALTESKREEKRIRKAKAKREEQRRHAAAARENAIRMRTRTLARLARWLAMNVHFTLGTKGMPAATYEEDSICEFANKNSAKRRELDAKTCTAMRRMGYERFEEPLPADLEAEELQEQKGSKLKGKTTGSSKIKTVRWVRMKDEQWIKENRLATRIQSAVRALIGRRIVEKRSRVKDIESSVVRIQTRGRVMLAKEKSKRRGDALVAARERMRERSTDTLGRKLSDSLYPSVFRSLLFESDYESDPNWVKKYRATYGLRPSLIDEKPVLEANLYPEVFRLLSFSMVERKKSDRSQSPSGPVVPRGKARRIAAVGQGKRVNHARKQYGKKRRDEAQAKEEKEDISPISATSTSHLAVSMSLPQGIHAWAPESDSNARRTYKRRTGGFSDAHGDAVARTRAGILDGAASHAASVGIALERPIAISMALEESQSSRRVEGPSMFSSKARRAKMLRAKAKMKIVSPMTMSKERSEALASSFGAVAVAASALTTKKWKRQSRMEKSGLVSQSAEDAHVEDCIDSGNIYFRCVRKMPVFKAGEPLKRSSLSERAMKNDLDGTASVASLMWDRALGMRDRKRQQRHRQRRNRVSNDRSSMSQPERSVVITVRSIEPPQVNKCVASRVGSVCGVLRIEAYDPKSQQRFVLVVDGDDVSGEKWMDHVLRNFSASMLSRRLVAVKTAKQKQSSVTLGLPLYIPYDRIGEDEMSPSARAETKRGYDRGRRRGNKMDKAGSRSTMRAHTKGVGPSGTGSDAYLAGAGAMTGRLLLDDFEATSEAVVASKARQQREQEQEHSAVSARFAALVKVAGGIKERSSMGAASPKSIGNAPLLRDVRRLCSSMSRSRQEMRLPRVTTVLSIFCTNEGVRFEAYFPRSSCSSGIFVRDSDLAKWSIPRIGTMDKTGNASLRRMRKALKIPAWANTSEETALCRARLGTGDVNAAVAAIAHAVAGNTVHNVLEEIKPIEEKMLEKIKIEREAAKLAAEQKQEEARLAAEARAVAAAAKTEYHDGNNEQYYAATEGQANEEIHGQDWNYAEEGYEGYGDEEYGGYEAYDDYGQAEDYHGETAAAAAAAAVEQGETPAAVASATYSHEELEGYKTHFLDGFFNDGRAGGAGEGPGMRRRASSLDLLEEASGTLQDGSEGGSEESWSALVLPVSIDSRVEVLDIQGDLDRWEEVVKAAIGDPEQLEQVEVYNSQAEHESWGTIYFGTGHSLPVEINHRATWLAGSETQIYGDVTWIIQGKKGLQLLRRMVRTDGIMHAKMRGIDDNLAVPLPAGDNRGLSVASNENSAGVVLGMTPAGAEAGGLAPAAAAADASSSNDAKSAATAIVANTSEAKTHTKEEKATSRSALDLPRNGGGTAVSQEVTAVAARSEGNRTQSKPSQQKRRSTLRRVSPWKKDLRERRALKKRCVSLFSSELFLEALISPGYDDGERIFGHGSQIPYAQEHGIDMATILSEFNFSADDASISTNMTKRRLYRRSPLQREAERHGLHITSTVVHYGELLSLMGPGNRKLLGTELVQFLLQRLVFKNSQGFPFMLSFRKKDEIEAMVHKWQQQSRIVFTRALDSSRQVVHNGKGDTVEVDRRILRMVSGGMSI